MSGRRQYQEKHEASKALSKYSDGSTISLQYRQYHGEFLPHIMPKKQFWRGVGQSRTSGLRDKGRQPCLDKRKTRCHHHRFTTERLSQKKRRAARSGVIDEIETWNRGTRKVQENKNLWRIFYKRRENMQSLSCLARPTTPILLMSLLIMPSMSHVYRNILCQNRADKEKAD